MAQVRLDFRGLKCPLPTLKLNQYVMSGKAHPGDTIEVEADCPTFEDDIKKWCSTSRKVLIKCYSEGTSKIAVVQF